MREWSAINQWALDSSEDDRNVALPGMLGTPDKWPPIDPAFEAEERRKSSGYGYSEDYIRDAVQRAWMRHVEDHNDGIRAKHRRAKACKTELLERIPRHAALVMSEKFERADAIESIEQWANDPERSVVVVSGPPGTGKTTLAAYWCVQHAQGEPSRIPVWLTATTFARGSRYDDDRDKILGAHALVLDDLGMEYADQKGSFRTDLDELVDRFYADRRRLFITTNLDAKMFEERYGLRVVDRLAEAGTWIAVTGTSRRRK